MAVNINAKPIIGQAGIRLLPETLRKAVLDDRDFLERFDLFLKTEGKIGFSGGPTFASSILFDAIREVDKSGGAKKVSDQDGKEWDISIETSEDGQIFASLSDNDQTFAHSEGALLLANEDARLAAFSKFSDSTVLPKSARTYWQSILKKQPLTDADVGNLHRDLSETPVRFAENLDEALRSGDAKFKMFVPKTRRYYERLIGKLESGASLTEHAQGGASARIRELLDWDEERGLLFVLLMASHSEFVQCIPSDAISQEKLTEVIDFLVESGDMLSRLGAAQLAIRLLPENKELIPKIEQLIELIRLEEPSSEIDGFSNLARLYLMIDSELSRRGILKGDPPFYRRMAAFAQASLIQRQLIVTGVDACELWIWIDRHVGAQFYAQSLVDMRTDPRWYPDLVQGEQLKQEFLGRLFGFAGSYQSQLDGCGLDELLSIKSTSLKSLASVADFPKPFFPGPLEGNLPPSLSVPDTLLSEIHTQLDQPQLSAKSFIAAINLANSFLIEVELAERIARLLKAGRYQLHQVADEDELAAILAGLARISGVTRSQELAQDVRILVRRYRRDSNFRLPISHAYRTLFFAASAFPDLVEWCVFVGQSLDDLAFGPLEQNEASELQAIIDYVCSIEPELWTVIGASESAIGAFLDL